MKFIKGIIHLLIIAVLTAVTQVGGFVWVVALYLSKRFLLKKRYIFPTLYLTFNLIIVPFIAPFFGRVQLPVWDSHLKPQNYFYTIAFRNYVNSNLKDNLVSTAKDLEKQHIEIKYLDAYFSFFLWFSIATSS